MSVLERSELEASPLSDLHAIADQIGVEGFRRMRKADLIDAILGEEGAPRRERAAAGEETEPTEREDAEREDADRAPRARRRRGGRLRRGRGSREDGEREEQAEPGEEADAGEEGSAPRAGAGARTAEGVVEVLGNGSAFVRVHPPEASEEDVYVSAAQVRRCELVSGDRVSGPVRTPRRSERYPSLVRVDTINGAPAESVSDGSRYDELAVEYPRERISLDARDRTLEAIEWLTPLGRGSRVLVVGARQSGKTETLRRLLEVLAQREELTVSVVLAGARPEEVQDWREGRVEPAAALTFAASADAQDQAVERTLDAAKRIASRGGDAVVLIDTLDALHEHAARKALAAARNLRDAGSLTVIATASRPLGGETTLITLDAALAATGREPIIDLAASATVRPELLVGAEGADAIRRARAAALEESA